jgi:hypothetical protein
MGLGAREAMPTLFDVTDAEEPTCPRLPTLDALSQNSGDERLVLVQWEDDDDDECCFDV